MKTVHLIFNSHIDPAWLWPWEAGLDAGLATFRSACDRLDEYPEFSFCNGDAWLLSKVEDCDPALFARIKAHVASGRWSLYGGWWVQPDCNIPTKAGFERQISLGRDYLKRSLGAFSDVARNVDSFGHSAALPEILDAAGQPNYIMSRPEPQEMKLPSRLFWWRGVEGSPAVLTFRMAGPYCFCNPEERAVIGQALNCCADLPEGVEDTLFFIGVGDHGGRVAKELIDVCRKLENAIPDVKLEFSTPERFFKKLRGGALAQVPEVIGELQHHSIGCYTLEREFKLTVKRTEHMLSLLPSQVDAGRLEESWRTICFNQFHDIMGGTCIPQVYPPAKAQVGGAFAFAEESLKLELRRRYKGLPPSDAQRIVVWNPSKKPFSGYIEFTPWVEKWQDDFGLFSKDGAPVPFQKTGRTFTFKMDLAPDELSYVFLRPVGASMLALPGWREVTTSSLVNQQGFGLSLGVEERVVDGGRFLPAPQLQLIDDPSDTWTHIYDRYLEGPCKSPVWNNSFLSQNGALLATLARTGNLDGMEVRSSFSVYNDRRFYELGLKISWFAKLKILKLVLPFKTKAVKRLDGIAADWGLARKLDGAERPACDWLLFELADGSKVGLVCPDVFAVDANAYRVRLTLLRSPVMANHMPALPATEDSTYSEQGMHEFRLGFDYSDEVSAASLAERAMSWLLPPLCGDLTEGMSSR